MELNHGGIMETGTVVAPQTTVSAGSEETITAADPLDALAREIAARTPAKLGGTDSSAAYYDSIRAEVRKDSEMRAGRGW